MTSSGDKEAEGAVLALGWLLTKRKFRSNPSLGLEPCILGCIGHEKSLFGSPGCEGIGAWQDRGGHRERERREIWGKPWFVGGMSWEFGDNRNATVVPALECFHEVPIVGDEMLLEGVPVWAAGNVEQDG